MSTSPVLKWCGGKTRLLPEITKRMPDIYGRYFEPFAGGAALFFAQAPRRAVLADQNADLMTLYRELRDNVDGVIRRLRVHKRMHAEKPRGRKSYYYDVRDRWNDRDHAWKPADRAAAFIYLNKAGFNGLYRVNRAGEFNVPIGDYDNPAICVAGRLRLASKLLARADLRTGDYATAVRDAKAGDFIFADPPYDPISATSNFTKYGIDGFSRDDQTELATLLRSLADMGCHVMASNNNTPFIRKLYREHGFKISRVSCGRSINSDTTKRAAITELLMTAGPS